MKEMIWTERRTNDIDSIASSTFSGPFHTVAFRLCTRTSPESSSISSASEGSAAELRKKVTDARKDAVRPGERDSRNSRRNSAEARIRVKADMEPEPAIAKEFANLLEAHDARMVRLHPDFGCETKYTLSVKANCSGRVMGASRYEGIHYDNGKLVGDNFFTIFMIADVGEIDFQNVDLRHAKVKLVSDFAPPTGFAQTKALYERLAGDGVTVDDLRITDRIEATEGKTFVVRAVAYKVAGLKVHFNQSRTQITAQFVSRSLRGSYDVTLAAKVVRRSEAGSIHLLWRPLFRKSPPSIRFAKNEVPRDFRTKRK